MRKSRFSEEQMVAVLREADATSVAAAAKKHKVSEQTIYAWRKHFGELAPSDVKRLRTLEAENARLKRLLAERDLDISVLKEINAKKVVSPQARREQVEFACERGLSERRACGLVGLSRSCLSYELRLPAKDAPVIEAMKTLSSQYPRYGYRRIRIFLRRAGHELGVHRAHRLWRQAGLQLPRRRPRRRIATGRPRPLPAANANFLWAYDFVFDATAAGQQIKCLTVVDEFTRECLAIDVAGSIRSKRVIDPGKPWQNANNESFNGKFRDECLSLEWFRSRVEAKVVIETWRRHYNAVRPHSSLDYLTPLEFKQQHPPIPNRAILQK